MHRTLVGAVTGILLLSACSRRENPGASATQSNSSESVTLDSAQTAAAGIRLGAVRALPPDTIRLTGTITFDADGVSHVGPRTQGRVRRVFVDIGTHVAAGDTLALLDSPELGAAQARWTQALLARDLAARSFERAGRLYRDGIVSQRRHLEAEAEFRNREAELAATVQALSVLGAQPDTTASGVFVLRAPFAGEVVDKHATVGEVVGPESSLFVVGQLDRVWLVLDLYEANLRQVSRGARALVVADAYPERPFEADVSLIGAIVDTVSRTIKVRLEILNRGHLLKPGMFARAGLATTAPAGAIGVARAAVAVIGSETVVFRRTATGEYRPHPVTVGPARASGWIEIRAGLAAGDSVVEAGVFVLRAQMLRAAGERGP